MRLGHPAARAAWWIACAGGLLVLGTPGMAGADWGGEETLREGVRTVINPAEPSGGVRTVTLREVWRLGDPADEEGEIFGLVASVFRDAAGDFALLDAQLSELRIYSPEGEFRRSVGRQGEGPGEFQRAGAGCRLPGGGYAVVQTWPGKLVLFGADGTPAGTLVPSLTDEAVGQSFLVAYEAAPAGDLLGIACMDQTFREGKLDRENVLGLFDREGHLVQRLLSHADCADLSQGFTIDEISSARLQGRWTVAPDGWIFAVDPFYGYEIQAFDPQGELALVIERPYESVARTPEEIAQVEELYAGFVRHLPNPQIHVEDRHRDIEQLQIGPGGHLWVQTSRGRHRAPEGSLGRFDVIDRASGHILHQVDLQAPGEPGEDSVYLLGDHVVVVQNYLAAVQGQIGGSSGDEFGEEEGEEGEEGVVQIVGYRIEP